MQLGRGRDNLHGRLPVCHVAPIGASIPAVSCPCHAVLFCFFPLSINLHFLLNVDTVESTAIAPRLMSILNPPQSTQSHTEEDWWQLLISQKCSRFYILPSPAALLLNCQESSHCPQERLEICTECTGYHLQIQIFAFSSDIWV